MIKILKSVRNAAFKNKNRYAEGKMERNQPKVTCKNNFKTTEEEQRRSQLNEKIAKLICRAEKLPYKKS